MSSKFEQIVEEIEDFIDGCKYQPLSNTKILVDKERLEELIADLRARTPEVIREYQKVVSHKEAILNDAREKANALIAQAQAQTNDMINEHEVMQQAYAQAEIVVKEAVAKAQTIIDDATNEANAVKRSAMQYTDDSLANLQNIIGHAIDTADAKYGSLVKQLRECGDIVDSNRAQLYPQLSMEADMASLASDKGAGAGAIPAGPADISMIQN